MVIECWSPMSSACNSSGRSEDKVEGEVDSFYESGPGRGQVSIDDYWLPSQQEQQGPSVGDHRRSLSSADQDSVIQGCFSQNTPPSLNKTPYFLF